MIKIVAVLLLAACISSATIPANSQAMIKQKYLALGDSYTIGESVEVSDRFPIQLTNQLKSLRFDIEDPQIIAKTGWTTDELMQAIEKQAPSNDFDLVTLLIGVNNQYRGRDIDNYRKEFRVLLHKAVEFAKGDKERVIVLSIPDYGVTPFGQKKGQQRIAKEIDQYNAINKEISEQAGVNYINITEISREALTQRNLIAQDDLHPSGEMYGLWVDEMMPMVLEILKSE
jgi:lysophospholipase L1-like esterase